jgi:hypothetical protein
MKTTTTTMRIAGALLALGMAAPLAARASSHREAPAIAEDPAADNTDLWAWVAPGAHDKLYVVAAYNPLEEPAGGPNFHKFSDDVLYEVHVTRGDQSLDDVVTYQFRFDTTKIAKVDPADLTAPPGGGKEFFSQLSGQKQTYSVWKVVPGKKPVKLATGVPVAPPRIGPFTYANFQKPMGGPAAYDDTFAAGFITPLASGEGRVWAGPRDDGFYVDLGGVFDAAQLRPKGTAVDNVAGYNCHAIAIEIPTNLLTADGKAPGSTPGDASTLGVWASASRREVGVILRNGTRDWFGPWVQVSRLGLPLINEAVIGLQDKDRYNRTSPTTDVANFAAYFLNPVVVRDAEAVGIYAALGVDPTPFKSNRLDIIDVINLTNQPTSGAHAIPLGATGDVLRVDMAIDSAFPNGRPIPGAAPNQEQADVTDVLLSVLLAKGMVNVSDGVDYNDTNYLPTFPYLALPWEGYSQGHGKPTP